MKEDLTIERRILERFLAKIHADEAVPPRVAERLRKLCEEGRIGAVDQILDALRQGVNDHAKDLPA